jgi:ligand-binding sensor domain-containing protein
LADLTVYNSAQGLNGTIIDAGSDEAQNIWAATADTLYVLQPGQTTFKRFTAADGLHIQAFTDNNGTTVSNITALAGGRSNEVFLGYRGYEQTIPPPAPPPCCEPQADFSDPRWHLGQADKVTLNQDGTIAVRRYEFLCDATTNCWEERSARRMVFGHSGTAAGHLFIGFDHGVVHVANDTWGDHIHVETKWHYPDGRIVTKQGDQYGLAIFPNGDLLTASGYGVGQQSWNVDPKAWVLGPYIWALTTYGPAEPYNNGEHDLEVPAEYREANRGAAITPDGTSWWVSATTGLSSYNHSIAQFTFSMTRHYASVPGLPATGLMDIAADPDGSLWIVDNGGRLLRFNPSSSTVQVWPGVSNARRVVMDTTVTPRALYVSMGNQGLGVIRAQ